MAIYGNLLVFHSGLVVFAALQVHEARTALVFRTEVPCLEFVVRTPFMPYFFIPECLFHRGAMLLAHFGGR